MADTAFHERLARINAGQGYVAEGLLAQGELNTIRKRQESGKAPRPVTQADVCEKKSISIGQVIMAFILGVIAYLGGSVGAFHATHSLPPELEQYRPLVYALGPVGMSGLLAVLLLYISGFRSIWLMGVIVAGVFAAQFAEPHMAQAAPAIWTQMYSAEHADALTLKAVSQTAQWGIALPVELTPTD